MHQLSHEQLKTKGTNCARIIKEISDLLPWDCFNKTINEFYFARQRRIPGAEPYRQVTAKAAMFRNTSDRRPHRIISDTVDSFQRYQIEISLDFYYCDLLSCFLAKFAPVHIAGCCINNPPSKNETA